ncbi:hypothetical protein AKJ16_DCAP20672 [Drosera capensis]
MLSSSSKLGCGDEITTTSRRRSQRRNVHCGWEYCQFIAKKNYALRLDVLSIPTMYYGLRWTHYRFQRWMDCRRRRRRTVSSDHTLSPTTTLAI